MFFSVNQATRFTAEKHQKLAYYRLEALPKLKLIGKGF